MQLTNISTIKQLCKAHGFSLSKGFGQNFIVNENVCPTITDYCEIDSTYGVLEIGPGIGVLTKELAKQAAKVVAIEVDDRLPPVLSQTLEEFDNVKIILQDVLKADINKIINEEFAGLKVIVCANLPYYITSPIIMKLLEDRLDIEHITVMVQKEVADRICASTGTRQCGAITYAVNYFAQAEILFNVQPGSFYPPPKVVSTVIQLRIHKNAPVNVKSEKLLMKLIRSAFNQRRKTAVNAISAGVSVPKQNVITALEKLNILPTARGEQLTLEDFANLANELIISCDNV